MESPSTRTDDVHARITRIGDPGRSAHRTEIRDERTAKERLIHTQTFESRLLGTPEAISARHGDAMVALLHAESARLEQLVKDDLFRAFVTAKEMVVAIQARVTPLSLARGDAERRARGNWIVDLGVAILALAGFAASVACEIAFNRSVVPWLMSTSPRSILGQALSLAPAITPIVLDLVFRMVFDVDAAWEWLVSRTAPNGRVRAFFRHALFVGVGALTVLTLWMLADAREVVTIIKNSPTVLGLTPLQQHAVDIAVRLLTIATAVNAAVFYLFGVFELRRSLDVRRARQEAEQLRAQERELEMELLTATAEYSAREREWSTADEIARAESEWHIADGMTQMETTLSRRQQPQSWSEMVEARLAASSSARVWPGTVAS